ncbi:hypothetical protein CC86DRAFT_45868 [Ophiobolus disseminans]|uniref:F-box domain-containing protein n=1 Tax=Ophiobolus disseminans TaxID=1469910 RepID=A0A6A6ZV11_9PLEO|nr:hypothetical protein CC86DRAFT_45868 [Ophiobolus disseminans]
MPQLPEEIYVDIFSYLSQRHLRNLLHTCRDFARLVRPLIFETLCFYGSPQFERSYRDPGGRFLRYSGRSKSVEIVSLEAAVNEVLALDIARYARRFEFGPKHYVEGFWERFCRLLERDAQDDGSQAYEEDSEYVSEGVYVVTRRSVGETWELPEKERRVVEKGEIIWAAKIEEQHLQADANRAGLVRLFENMLRLRDIEIVDWRSDLAAYGCFGDQQ